MTRTYFIPVGRIVYSLVMGVATWAGVVAIRPIHPIVIVPFAVLWFIWDKD